MASKLTLIALALGATLISSACSEQSKPDKVAKNFLDSIYSGNVNHAVKLMYKPKDAAAYEDNLVAQIKSIGSMLFFVGSIKSHLSNLNLFKPQGLSIISSKAPRGIHNFQEEVLRVWYAITSSSNCFNQLNCTLTFS